MGLPVQVPLVVLRVWPWTVEPLIAGSALLVGALGGVAAATTAVGPEVAEPEPPALVAVTTARMVLPTSLADSVYVEPEAPLMVVQLPPELLQSCHAYL